MTISNNNNDTNILEPLVDAGLNSIVTVGGMAFKGIAYVANLVFDVAEIFYKLSVGTYEYDNDVNYKPSKECIPTSNMVKCEIPTKCKYKRILGETDNTLKAFIGVGEDNNIQCLDFYKDGSVLIGGASRFGKTGVIYSILLSLMDRYEKEYLRIVLVDFKRVDLIRLEKYEHICGRCITELEPFKDMLKWIRKECDNRTKLFNELDVANIQEFNSKSEKQLQPIVIVIDEIAQVLQQKKSLSDELRMEISRLVSISMGFGIYWVVCTQELSRDTLGKMKINFTQSIGLKCIDKTASDLIIKNGELEDITLKGRCKIDNSEGVTEFQSFYCTIDDIRNILSDKVKG